MWSGKMMKLRIEIDEEKTEAVMEGACSNKAELYAAIGLMEDMKFKLLSATQDDGSTKAFVLKMDKDKMKDGEV